MIDLTATTAPTSNDDPLMDAVYKNLFIEQQAQNEQWGGNGDILAATP